MPYGPAALTLRNPIIRRKPFVYEDGLHLDFTRNGDAGFHYSKAAGAQPIVGPFSSFVTTTRAGTATRINAAGLVEDVPANTARIDYSGPNGFAGVGQLLRETASTNLSLQSEDFTTTWATTNAIVSANSAIAPDGAIVGDEIIDTAVNARHYVVQSIVKAAAAIRYTASVWCRARGRTFANIRVSDGPQTGDARVAVNLENGFSETVAGGVGFTIQSAGAVSFPGGWWRITLSFTSSADALLRFECGLGVSSNPSVLAYLGDGVSGALFWGAQMEQLPLATSYIRCAAAPVTRAADSYVRNSPLWAGFTIPQQSTVIRFTPSYISNTANNWPMRLDDSGAFQNLLNISIVGLMRHVLAAGYGTRAISANNEYGVACSSENNSQGMSVNGQAVETASLAQPAALNRFSLGGFPGFDGDMSLRIKTVGVWNRTMLPTELIQRSLQ